MRRRCVLLALLPAIMLAACGKDDEQAIRDAIRSSLTTTDPDDCAPGAHQTAAFLRQHTFGSAPLQKVYVQRCRDDIERFAARSVTVWDVKVDGDEAEATFKADGGQYAFARASVALKRSDGRWRLDRLRAIELDRAAYDSQQVQFARGVGTLSARAAACFSRRLANVSDSALEAAIVRSRPGVFADPFLVCFHRAELRKRGLDPREARCVILRLRRDPDTLMRHVFAGTKPAQRELRQRVTAAASACAAR